MPRGEHPNSRKALEENRKPFDRETALKAKKKSDEAKELAKSFIEIDADDPNTQQDRVEMLKNLKKQAKRNLRAFEIYRDTVGLKPKENIKVDGKIDTGTDALAEILQQLKE